MIKTIIKIDNGKLGIGFTDRETQEFGLICGDKVDIEDMLIQKIKRKENG